MPDVPIPPEPEPTRAEEFYQAVWGFGGYVDAQVRRAVTGDTDGRLRRPVLFVLVGLSVVMGGPASGIMVGVGLIALILLAFTDNSPVTT